MYAAARLSCTGPHPFLISRLVSRLTRGRQTSVLRPQRQRPGHLARTGCAAQLCAAFSRFRAGKNYKKVSAVPDAVQKL